jgi:hypothetical protein
VAKALHALRSVRNDFAHSADDTSLAAPYHRKRLAPACAEARANPLWPPLEAILEAQGGLDADQRQFILLVTVLVAFIESSARLQQPFQPRATPKLETPKLEVMENRGLEPLTSAVRSQRSTS